MYACMHIYIHSYIQKVQFLFIFHFNSQLSDSLVQFMITSPTSCSIFTSGIKLNNYSSTFNVASVVLTCMPNPVATHTSQLIRQGLNSMKLPLKK